MCHSRVGCDDFIVGVCSDMLLGGALFQKLRDEVDDIYNKLPPPKPSRAPSSGYSGGSGRPSYSAPVSMSYYNSSAAPCFAGTSSVLMANGCTKYVY